MRRRLAAAASAATAPRHPKGTLAATILGSSLAFVDGSVVNVALPAVERDLASSGASGASIGWLINAYLLPLGALVLVGGVAGDRYGRKRMFLAGIAVFTVASLACALAPGFGWLLAARALQGVGAALLVPASLALLGAAFEGEARGRAVGTWAAASAITGALGPLAGGWLVDAVGWRAIFFINLPIAAAAAWLAWRKVDESRSDDAAPLDLVGAALATVGLGLATFGLTALAARGADATVHGGAVAGSIALAAGVVALVAFVLVEARLGRARDDAARVVRYQHLRRRDLADAVPLRRAERHGRAAAVPADHERRLGRNGRRRGAAAALGRRWGWARVPRASSPSASARACC